MLRKFRKLRRLLLVAGLGVTFAGISSVTLAAKPTPDAALELVPVQKDVQFTRPAKDGVAKCTVDTINSDGVTGWIVRDGTGQVLRRFLDTNKDNKLDQWCYYREGIETYRDVDADFNGKADQYRWLGTAGIRWGVDTDEDGRIDSWNRISPEEVTAEVVAALRDHDVQRFARLLVTADELKSLGLGDRQSREIAEKTAAAREAFEKLAAKQKLVTARTTWTNFGATQPGLVPVGTDGSTKDVVVYDNVAAVVETEGKHAQVAIGTMLQAGDTWRLIDLPASLQDDKTAVASSGYFFNVLSSAVARAPMPGEVTAEVQKLTEQLESLEKDLARTDAPDRLSELNGKRADILERLFQAANTDEERETWVRQLADSISTAVQMGNYPDGVARLGKLAEQLQQNENAKEQQSYVRFRMLLAQYSQEVQDPQADPAKIQANWVANLEAFVTEYPDASDSAEAMLQLAIAQEFANKSDDAAKWYGKIVTSFASSDVAKKAAGAKTRLELIGRSMPLRGRSLDGKAFDLTQLRGQTVLVHYWATWCEPCKQDMVKLRELQAKYARQKLTIVGVNLDNEAKPVVDFLKTARLSWTHLHEPGGLESRYATELGIFTLPTMILIDSQGRVVNRNIHAAELDSELAKIFRDPSVAPRGAASGGAASKAAGRK